MKDAGIGGATIMSLADTLIPWAGVIGKSPTPQIVTWTEPWWVMVRHAQRLRGHARCVTIDLDPTDDPTHGAQQLSFFNTHYDSWCYLPVMGFVSFNDEAEQYLCAAVLRPGNVTAPVGAVGSCGCSEVV